MKIFKNLKINDLRCNKKNKYSNADKQLLFFWQKKQQLRSTPSNSKHTTNTQTQLNKLGHDNMQFD